jgi:hypothetical protein
MFRRGSIMASATSSVTNNDERAPVAGNWETDLKNKVEHAGAVCMDKAKELGSSVMTHAQDAASAVAHSVGDAGATIGQKANDATAAVGSGMESLAGTIRQHLPREGALRTASSSVANSLERGGHYLRQEGLGGMGKDITNLIRQNPIPALLVGVGIGFLLAKITARGFGHGK